MIIALYSLIPIFLSLLAGMDFHRLKLNLSYAWAGHLSNACLYLLLLGMGITIGQVPDIVGQLVAVGRSAAVVAVGTSAVIALFVWLLSRVMRPHGGVGVSHATGARFDIYTYLKDPAQLLGLVAVGFVLSYLGWVPRIDYDLVVTYLLYAMIFFIGMRLSQSNIKLREILLNKFSIALAATTVAGSLVGAWLVSYIVNLPVKDTMAVSAGFGWYTLSGILLTQMNAPILGSIAFLSDLFREVIALLLIPMLAKKGHAPIAIGICGATCMDVTLPIIEKHCAAVYIPVAFISGAIITVLVPFMIPFFYYLK